MQYHSITTFNEMLTRVSQLYTQFAPHEVKNRKNIHLAKQPDEVLITCYLFGILVSCTSISGIYRLAKSMFGKKFPERTRFSRTINNLKQTIELMNQGLIQSDEVMEEQLGIIDSLPVPLCHPVRNFKAKAAKEIADIGFNATKQIWFYGLKFHAIVSQSGLILNFVLSSASFHDAKVCEDCITDFHIPMIIGDAGYIGKELRARCADKEIALLALPRKNMSNKGVDFRPVKAIRKTVETVFSGLQNFGIERLTLYQMPSIISRILLTVLLYNLLEVEAHKTEPMSLKWTKGLHVLMK